MSKDIGYPNGFLDAVTAWVKTKREARGGWNRPPLDAVVTGVRSEGSDWEGSTEGGFYSSFEVRIEWEAPGGRVGSFHVEGENMADLWRFVIAGFRSGDGV